MDLAESLITDFPSLSESDSDPARWPALESEAVDLVSRTASSPDPVPGCSVVAGLVSVPVTSPVPVSGVRVTGL